MVNIYLDGLRKEVAVAYFQVLSQNSSEKNEKGPKKTYVSAFALPIEFGREYSRFTRQSVYRRSKY
jgi:hypothetical protein